MKGMNRREFFKVSLMAGASSLVAARLAAEGVDASAAVEAGAPDVTGGRLLGSAPVLQNAAETTMGVAFAVSAACVFCRKAIAAPNEGRFEDAAQSAARSQRAEGNRVRLDCHSRLPQ